MTNNRPLNVVFVITSMPVGGAETLLVNLVRRMDRKRINPSIFCLKEKDVLGEELAGEIPVYSDLIGYKFDVTVVRRLKKMFREQNVDAVITVGAGDKMFWGRLAASYAKVPVILSALHSTGWPDGVGRMNRLLTRITDGFIACADSHGEFLVDFEKFPRSKVFVIQNGIDTKRFTFDAEKRRHWREKYSISPTSPVVGIVAALRPEKNHELFLRTAANVVKQLPECQFVIAGDGPERPGMESLVADLKIENSVHFLGTSSDVPGILSMTDLFALTSHNEAKPVSILEALSCERPVVATDVGSVSESVQEGETGFLVPAGDLEKMTEAWVKVLKDSELAKKLGAAGRERVQRLSSLERMTSGYMELVESLYARKTGQTYIETMAAEVPESVSSEVPQSS